jgi:cell division septal protein FtsQ
MANTKSSTQGRNRRRRVVGAANVRAFTPAPRRTVRASRRAYFQLYLPRFSFNPWRTERDWHARRPRFFAGVLLILFALGLYQLFSNPVFYVDSPAFSGNRFLTPTELAQASGIRGWNIFFVDTHEVEAELKRLPAVKDARVTMSLPNHVQAQIVERLPRMVWETRGATYWVDDDGIALPARAALPGLLWLKDDDGAAVRVGDRVNTDAFNAVVSLHNAWQNGPRVFEWSQAHGLALHNEHGWLIYLGDASQMQDKLAALKIVTAQISQAQKTIAFIDLGSGLPYYQEVAAKK